MSPVSVAGFLIAFVLGFWLAMGVIALGCDGVCFDRLGYVLIAATAAGIAGGTLLELAARRLGAGTRNR
jgi:hypothetical protein